MDRTFSEDIDFKINHNQVWDEFKKRFMRGFFAVSILLTLFGCMGCSSLLYYPQRVLYQDPASLGFHPDDIYIESSKDVTINAWFFKHKANTSTKGIFVFFHGNGENLSSHYMTLLWLLDFDYDYLIFDYQGYGKSQGEPSPKGTLEDGIAALRWVHMNFPKKPIFIFGQSLGGAVAMKTVIEFKNEIPISGVFVDSTFLSYKSEARDVLAKTWFTWILQPFTNLLLSDKYAPGNEVEKISPIPLIVIHGDNDQTVAIEQGRAVFEKAKEPKEFWLAKGGKHTDALWRNHQTEFRQKILDKVNQLTVASH